MNKAKKPTTTSPAKESKAKASPSTKKKSWERPGLKGKKELSMLERIALIGAKNVLDTDEVILYTGLTRTTIYQLTTAGKIPYYKAEHNSHLEGGKELLQESRDRQLAHRLTPRARSRKL